jgi:hypothetical protein
MLYQLATLESSIQTSDEETGEPIVNKISVRRRSAQDLPPITESQKKEKLTKIFMQ